MRLLFVFALLTTVSVSTFSAATDRVYECPNVGGNKGQLVLMNLNTDKAIFFDNGVESELALTKTHVVRDQRAQVQMVFEGAYSGYINVLKLYFNFAAKSVELYSIDQGGAAVEVPIGSALCHKVIR